MTLHGVEVITNLYFAIFAAFQESMTLNLVQRSFKVMSYIMTARQSKAHVRLYIGR